jgi:proline iminopeptidase
MAQIGQAIRGGYLDVTGGRVWYEIVGGGDGLPLLTLHGGPGFPHDYMEPLGALGDQRPVIFYDQLGCGRSDRPDDGSLWRIERFTEEVKQVVAGLNLERYHLIGHSWGGMLAIDFALTQPPGLVGLILASPVVSVSRFVKDLARLLAEMPVEMQAAIDKKEKEPAYEGEDYTLAEAEFYRRHLFGDVDPDSEIVQRTFAGMGQEVYGTMQGDSELTVRGNLKDYERADRMGEIEVPVLLTCGRTDECTPESMAWAASLIPAAELVVFEESAHMPHLTETERYNSIVRSFLARHDG